MPRQRAVALVELGDAVASGRLRLDPGADRSEARQVLLGIPGIGPWTADYVAMRALGDPDVMAGGDLVVWQQAARTRDRAVRAVDTLPRVAPWRTTVVHHLWAADDSTTSEKEAA